MRIGAHPRARWLPAALFLLLFYASSGRRSRHYTPACVHSYHERLDSTMARCPPVELRRASCLFLSLNRLRTSRSRNPLVSLSLSLLKLTLQNILLVPHEWKHSVSRVHPLATSPRSIVYIYTRRRGCSHRHVPRLRADTRTTETGRCFSLFSSSYAGRFASRNLL